MGGKGSGAGVDRAAAVLAKAWYRAWRGWWWASAGALALVLVLVLGTAGLLDGMERQTEERVADFYTGDLRLTATRPGAAPPGGFGFNTTTELDQAMAELQDEAGSGALVVPRLETTYLLSRRSLVEAYLFEDDQYGVALPGVASEEDAYNVGVLAGLPLTGGDVRALLRPYLVTGAFPEASSAEGNGTVHVLMSLGQYRSMLSETEREEVGRIPSAGELASLRLEITAARVDESGPFKDIIRYPARVSGLYVSGIDALDRITLVSSIEDARRLLGVQPEHPEVNAFSIHGGDGSARQHAQDNGWTAEGPGPFTQRYLGQLVNVVRVLGLSLSSLLLVFPFFMVWTGMAQQLDRSRREMAVCRAIGMEARSVRSALLGLILRVAILALVPAVLVLALAAFLLPDWLAGTSVVPFPVGFALPWWAVAITAANLVVATAVALAGALRRHRLGDLATTLRSL